MRESLVSDRLRALDPVLETVDQSRLSLAQVEAWCGALNDIRLVLGERLGVTEELYETGIDRHDPRAPELALYSWLTWLQGEVVEALAARLADASRRDVSGARHPTCRSGRLAARDGAAPAGRLARGTCLVPGTGPRPAGQVAAAAGRVCAPRGSSPDRRQHLVALRLHQLARARLEVQPEQRLRVRRADVEVPVVGVDGDPVEVADRPLVGVRSLSSWSWRHVRHRRVQLTRDEVALPVRGEELRELPARFETSSSRSRKGTTPESACENSRK